MNTIPATILDDFLPNPNSLRKWALEQKYHTDPKNLWPGKRSEPLHILHPPLYTYLGVKILSLFFETLPLNWNAMMHFQLISNLEGTGWVHQDSGHITSILYLTPESNINCGSSLYKPKKTKPHPIMSSQDINSSSGRFDHYKTKKLTPNSSKTKEKFENETYEKILDVKDKYNRLFSFSSTDFHSANNYSPQNGEDRLTLIMFFRNIAHPIGFPIFRSTQVPI